MRLCKFYSPVSELQIRWFACSFGLKSEELARSLEAHFSTYYIQIPPFNEQKCIVTKREQLMSLCNEVETKLTQSKT